MTNRIVLTKQDLDKLSSMVESRHAGYSYDRPYLDTLERELDRADIVDSYAVTPDIVTMNSEVLLKDLATGEENLFRLVFPSHVRSENDVSVIAPIGTAMLGCGVGDIVEWPDPKGVRRLQILKVLFQPEAAERAVLS